MSRPMTKCTSCKYHPEDESLTQTSDLKYKMYDQYPHNKKECKQEYNILPNGYLQRK
jgi:hypothetical protein